MINNKIIIGDKLRDKKGTKPDLFEIDTLQITTAVTDREAEKTEQIPVDENVWGNDYIILNKLSKKQLADRRLYVRIRHFQKIECFTVYDEIDVEPACLTQPIIFIINEISMGCIGAICDYKLSIGKILAIQLTIDNMPYDIKCEVGYCIKNDDKFRCGLKVVQRDRQFIKHLKIYIARKSLLSNYG